MKFKFLEEMTTDSIYNNTDNNNNSYFSCSSFKCCLSLNTYRYSVFLCNDMKQLFEESFKFLYK